MLKAASLATFSHFVFKSVFADDTFASPVRLAFGSCNNQLESQDFWNTIADTNPDIWIGLGDNIYADFASPERRGRAYDKVRTSSGFQRLLNSATVAATWDDHDYGFNNASGEYAGKDISQKLFLDFMGEPEESPRRQQKGVYNSVVQGNVEFLLLDLRYFKPGRNSGGTDYLGAQQWEWLEERVKTSPAKVLVVGSSVQMLSDVGTENWGRYPESRKRLIQIFEKANRPIVVLSGDRHFYEVSQTQLINGQKLVEITSSGLTHKSNVQKDNPYRVGNVVHEKNFCLMEFNFANGISVSAKACDPETGSVLRQDHWVL